ncbi:MAG: VWA domain-containing protein [Hyphomicrobium sp.]
MIVFDASGSMATSDYSLKVPRIARLKQAMARVLPEIAPLRRLGLIVYGEGAYNDCSSIALRMRPTSDAAGPMLRIIEAVNPRGRTPLTQSVRQAAEVLDYTKARSRRRARHRRRGDVRTGSMQGGGGAEESRPGPDGACNRYRDGQDGYFRARCMADATGGHMSPLQPRTSSSRALRKTLGCPFVTEDATGRPMPRFACALPRRLQ